MNLIKEFIVYKLKLFIVIFSIILPVVALVFSFFLITYFFDDNNNQQNEGITLTTQEKTINPKEKAKNFISDTFDMFDKENKVNPLKEKERINILLLGRASEDYPGSHLTDTIILASYKPKTNQAAMLSIPRDLYVKIPDTQRYTKINFIYHYGRQKNGEAGGIEYMRKTVKEITNQNIDYYVMLDFIGFEKLINQIGGVTVDVAKELHDDRYPGPNFSYQTFHINPGVQTLDGGTALKYVRTRHNPDGDFGRAYRQQQVLEAVKKKIFEMNNIDLLSKVSEIKSIINENINTNIEQKDYPYFLNLANDLNLNNVTNKVLDNRGEKPILVSSSARLGFKRAYFLKPVGGDYTRVHEIAENIFDLDKLRLINEKREQEKPKILINDKSNNYSNALELKKRLNQFGFQNITVNNTMEVQENTIIIDFTEGLKPYSLDIINKSLQAEDIVSKEKENINYDIEINIGTDIENIFIENNILLPREAYREQEYE